MKVREGDDDMPNGRIHRSLDDFGFHDYGEGEGTVDCKFGCGCWIGPTRGGGPVGLDHSTFGHCPNNPKQGESRPKDDYEDCVIGRIRDLEERLHKAQEAERIVKQAKAGTKIGILKEMKKLKEQNARLRGLQRQILSGLEALLAKTREL